MKTILLITTLALLALSGCQSRPPAVAEPAPPLSPMPPAEQRKAGEAELMALLDYYRNLQHWSPSARDSEIKRTREALSEKLCERQRLELALLLLHDHPTPNDSKLLAPCLNAGATTATRKAFALLLQDMLQERAHQQASAAALEAELTQQREENSKLRRQLDGLRAIERSLQDRDRPTAQGRRP